MGSKTEDNQLIAAESGPKPASNHPAGSELDGPQNVLRSPEQKPGKRLIYQHTQIRTGPLPDPAELQAYNYVIPNGAERILAMAEAQSSHRISIETLVITSQQNQAFRGQIFGFIIAMSGLLGGIYCAVNGAAMAGAAIGGLPLVSLAGVFVLGKRSDKRELADKKTSVETTSGVRPSPAP